MRNFEDAALRKSAKYLDLADQAELNGYHTTLLTLQVGSRGVPDYASFSRLATLLDMSARDREGRVRGREGGRKGM